MLIISLYQQATSFSLRIFFTSPAHKYSYVLIIICWFDRSSLENSTIYVSFVSHIQHFLMLVTQKILFEIQCLWDILLSLTNINPVSIDHLISLDLLHAYSNCWIEHSLFKAKIQTIILMLMMTRGSQMRTSYFKGQFWLNLWWYVSYAKCDLPIIWIKDN